MQTVTAAFTAEARDSVRSPSESLQISWHKDSTLGNRTFTIGVSTIGGNDAIGINPGAIGSPSNYRYFDESTYALSLGWERGFNLPLGGLSKAFAEARLDNTSQRFTPKYMGGVSELYTAILPSRPVMINAGFNVGGINQNIPKFAGIVSEIPQVDVKTQEVQLKMVDYLEFFSNKYVDKTAMYTGQRTDQLIEKFLIQLGMSTSQYTLDTGQQTINFLMATNGTKFADLIDQIVQAENGNFYQDERGMFIFENNIHWDNNVLTARTIRTDDVLESYMTNRSDSHLINVVEVTSNPLQKHSSHTIYTLTGTIELAIGSNDVFVEFTDPVLAASAPVYTVNSLADGSGINISGSVSITSTSVFAQNAKYVFNNASGAIGYITSMTIQGRDATPIYSNGLYYRAQDDSSVTAYNEQPLQINNDYIQSQTWAQSYASLILGTYSDPESLQTIVIRAMPHLQLGDLVSWQGVSWRIYDIKTTYDAGVGFIQELALLQRTPSAYFKIGVSTIGSTDPIAP